MMKNKVCRKCLYEWQPRVRLPKKCPRCGCAMKVDTHIAHAFEEANPVKGVNLRHSSPEYYGHTYAVEGVQDSGEPITKIGMSTNPIDRVVEVRSTYKVSPGRVYISGLTADFREAERAAHHRFSGEAHYREWFHTPFEEIKDYMANRPTVILSDEDLMRLRSTENHQELWKVSYVRDIKPVLVKHGLSLDGIADIWHISQKICKQDILGPCSHYRALMIKNYIRDHTNCELFK